MDLHNIKNLRALAEALGKKLADGERYFTSVLATRLSKAASENPSDITLRSMASYLEQRSENGKHIITRSELKDVYGKLYTVNNKCASLLEKELGVPADKLPKERPQHVDESLTYNNIKSFANQQLVNSLESALTKQASVKVDPKLGAFASIVCQKNLPGNPKVEAIAARDGAVICKASYETPKGVGTVIVPVEVVGSLPVAPSKFVTKFGFVTISADNIEQHLIETAGTRFTLNTDNLFEAMGLGGIAKEAISDPEFAALMLNDPSKYDETPSAHDPNGILTQGFETPREDIKTSRTPESFVFEQKFAGHAGLASLAFGKDTVEKARSMVLVPLKRWGFSNPQVKITNATESEITVSASINGCGFDVPVKVVNAIALPPKMILAGGSIGTFTQEGVKEAVTAGDRAIGAKIAGYNLDRPEQLVEQVRESCDNGDMVRAAAALDALSACGDKTAFATGFAVYSRKILGTETVKTASVTPKLKTIKIGGNEVCAKTGLPADKVYVDANGDVQLKSRRNQEKTDDYIVGGFMNSKILLGM